MVVTAILKYPSYCDSNRPVGSILSSVNGNFIYIEQGQPQPFAKVDFPNINVWWKGKYFSFYI